MKNVFVRFVREDAGQDMIEYALVAGIISIGAIATIGTLKTKLVTLWTNVDSAVGTAS
mgnify:CR=1 FL=1